MACSSRAPGDLLTAEHLGRRVATVALQLARGRAAGVPTALTAE